MIFVEANTLRVLSGSTCDKSWHS